MASRVALFSLTLLVSLAVTSLSCVAGAALVPGLSLHDPALVNAFLRSTNLSNPQASHRKHGGRSSLFPGPPLFAVGFVSLCCLPLAPNMKDILIAEAEGDADEEPHTSNPTSQCEATSAQEGPPTGSAHGLEVEAGPSGSAPPPGGPPLWHQVGACCLLLAQAAVGTPAAMPQLVPATHLVRLGPRPESAFLIWVDMCMVMTGSMAIFGGGVGGCLALLLWSGGPSAGLLARTKTGPATLARSAATRTWKQAHRRATARHSGQQGQAARSSWVVEVTLLETSQR
ncbi:hypothetical protein KFL_004450110 [Klebsormidium nitens]|uniref:Uncharacterized protein n=1 Tax=Klebsormidium nitens TaxID=105231 RepID=A0A1Y1ICC5_KLENI|nr:hypothetical protein KFL_004450110 [Klebsormidium nitens]|eukprot:GAQ88624.1 hypothetical protein KFL_004450110 [Klebsormidium nitens]